MRLALAAATVVAAIVHLACAAVAPARDGWPAIALTPLLSGVRNPVYVTHAGDGSGRLFVLEQAGLIRIVDGGRLLAVPFLDIRERISAGGERGLLGLAFHPRYRDNRRYVVNYTRERDGATVIAEYHASADRSVSSRDERVLLVIEQPYANHNGGMVAFGPDGFLYIGMGDGGSAGDPENRAQNLRDLLGKMLRIDVDGATPYAVPPDNPFASGGGRPEIWALGLRNPWRFSFDRANGALWAGDVGQNRREEIDIVRRGGNYGWRIMEGSLCFRPPTGCSTRGLELPVAEYATHSGGRCSVTGGYVHRGRRSPALGGIYFFGDYCSGEIFGLHADRPQAGHRVLLKTRMPIASFGEDEEGEVLVVGHDGQVQRIVEAAR